MNGVTTFFAMAAMLVASVVGVLVADMIRRLRRNRQVRVGYLDSR
jgi:hypothetical protein